MAAIISFRQAVSWLYTLIAASIFGSWSLLALCLTGLAALGKSNVSLVILIADPSLLAYLVSKFIVITTGDPGGNIASNNNNGSNRQGSRGNLAQWIASADYGSPHGALVLFLLGLAWVWSLAQLVLILGVVTFVGGVLLLSVYLAADQEAVTEAARKAAAVTASGFAASPITAVPAAATTPVVPMMNAMGVEETPVNLTQSLIAFKEETGVDLAEWFGMLPPRVLLPLVVLVWFVVGTLALYVAAKTLGSLRRVLSASSEEWASRGDEAQPKDGLVRTVKVGGVDVHGEAVAVTGFERGSIQDGLSSLPQRLQQWEDGQSMHPSASAATRAAWAAEGVQPRGGVVTDPFASFPEHP